MYAKAVIVAELASKLRQNEGILLIDLLDHLNNILSSNGQQHMTKSSHLLLHLQQELGSHLDAVFIKGCRRQGYLPVRSKGDLHHALYCALIDKKADRNVQADVKSYRKTEPQAETMYEEIILSSLNIALNKQAHLWAEKAKAPEEQPSFDGRLHCFFACKMGYAYVCSGKQCSSLMGPPL